MKTLLQLVQAATSELGIARPNLVVGVTTTDTLQLLALANGLGGELQREYDWQNLVVEYRLTTQFLQATGTTTSGSPVLTDLSSTSGLDSTYQVLGAGINTDTNVQSLDSATQVTLSQPATASGTVALTFCKTKYPMPADYDRQVDRTQWDKSRHWELLGPETSQQWQWLKSGYISTGPRLRYRMAGGQLEIWPAISAAEVLGFEYISNGWVIGADGARKTEFTADTDTCIFPDRLMIEGLKVWYQRAKGLGNEYQDAYDRQLSLAKGNDSPSPTLSMAPRPADLLIGMDNIPDSGYGQ